MVDVIDDIKVNINIPPTDLAGVGAGGFEDVPSFVNEEFKEWRKKFSKK